MYRPDLWLDNIILFGGNVIVAMVSYYVNSSALAMRRGIVKNKTKKPLFTSIVSMLI
jgi:hypothetical protein